MIKNPKLTYLWKILTSRSVSVVEMLKSSIDGVVVGNSVVNGVVVVVGTIVVPLFSLIHKSS